MNKILFATTNHHKIRIFKLAWEQSRLKDMFELIFLNDLNPVKEDIEENYQRAEIALQKIENLDRSMTIHNALAFCHGVEESNCFAEEN